ncbi:GSCOCG00007260001-RA-CDS [Cotesia congregata]|uniref:ribose-5-phosphate isomerase n=1 Tax=Cotesia congregata TaxID=51543 RepID=A0A8J2EDH5_COTCN|nr:GSCOCG00007260001-RA-CDS [Cotesia congregata]CAG5076137.1 Similar to RPIA: Ribose-5-phosphate isomerase (Homo sapiens) [Cotesia congregata]
MSPLEIAKKKAAFKAVDEFVKSDCVIGIGSGSTVIYAVNRIAEKVKIDGINVVCVPTSFQSRQLIIDNNLTLGDLDKYPKLDCVIDGADEVDGDKTLIKGGGGCLLQEKIVASCTDNLIIIADYTKNSIKLGQQYKKGIPIEVIPMGYAPIKNKIQDIYGGAVNIRMAIAKAGPVVTDNGNFILDWIFPDNLDESWNTINNEIKLIPGVVEIGLFVKMAKKIYFGMPDGTVKIQ